MELWPPAGDPLVELFASTGELLADPLTEDVADTGDGVFFICHITQTSLGLRVQDSRFGVQGLGLWVQDSGFRDLGFRI